MEHRSLELTEIRQLNLNKYGLSFDRLSRIGNNFVMKLKIRWKLFHCYISWRYTWSNGGRENKVATGFISKYDYIVFKTYKEEVSEETIRRRFVTRGTEAVFGFSINSPTYVLNKVRSCNNEKISSR